ncbi:protein BEAN1 [Microcaecilia unicolor]|uniref:Protein BEAN1-like n=1 Tax=Microcaecilia unicolor TaxID=1415580 RepID=A0A6P7Y5Q1_9AMPH|nr:protein BEAN1-like [Microcaecilia unicolor]
MRSMEIRAAYLCTVFIFHIHLASGTSGHTGLGRNYSSFSEQSILPCKKEALECGKGPCLLNWLHCHYQKDCGREYMAIKLTCSKIHSNQSSPIECPSYSESNSDTSFLVSPLVVAGIVIGLVLFLSCVTIIVGSLRKDGRLRQPHLRTDAGYGPDSSSYGGSNGELRSACIEEFSPVFDLGSYMETVSQVNIGYPDSPPCYDECVGPRATQIYIPTDDPPPYSMDDPYRNESSMSISLEEMTPGMTEGALDDSVQVQERQLPLSSISFSTVTFGAATHHKNVASGQSRPFPLIPLDTPKNSSTPQSHAFSNRIM